MRSILFLAKQKSKRAKQEKRGKNSRCLNVTQNLVEREKYVKQFAVCWKVIATQTKMHDKLSRCLSKGEKTHRHFFIVQWSTACETTHGIEKPRAESKHAEKMLWKQIHIIFSEFIFLSICFCMTNNRKKRRRKKSSKTHHMYFNPVARMFRQYMLLF